MDVLNFSPMDLRNLSSNSLFTSRFPTNDSKRRNQIRYTHKNFTLPNYYSPLPNKSSFLVFAHFGRRTTRRNSLRKKLINGHKDLVSHVPPDIQQSSPNLEDRQRRFNDDIVSVRKIDYSLNEPKSKPIGDSVLYNKLDTWVEQYKRDTEFWGLGSGPIFTIYESSDGNVEKVSVNKDEILRRSRAEKGFLENSVEANLKILEAERLAREMESGKSVIPRNSSVAKFVLRGNETSFWTAIQSLRFSPNVVKEAPKVGIMLLYGVVAAWALKKLFDFRNKEVALTEPEKEMMRRKIKSRKEREVFEKDGVEVVQEPFKPPVFTGEKPRLDKQELMKDIARAKKATGNLALTDSSTAKAAKSAEVDVKIEEIRKMAREAREFEKADKSFVKSGESEGIDEETYEGTEVESEQEEVTIEQRNDDVNDSTSLLLDKAFGGNGNVASPLEISDVQQTIVEVIDNMNHNAMHLSDNDDTSGRAHVLKESLVREKPRIIRSVKEARDYLSERRHSKEGKEEPRFEAVSDSNSNWQREKQYDDDKQQNLGVEEKVVLSSISDETSDSEPVASISDGSITEDDGLVSITNGKPKPYQEITSDESDGENSETGLSVRESWNEQNVNEQIAKKLSTGFRDNYMAARENKNSPAAISSLEELRDVLDSNELDWLEDDRLAEIVFRVRENELAGREPFHEMESKDKDAFFEGLEKKVERENEKLSVLHDWLHSNIENLDYGVDGISIYDSPEKIKPRWKGPILEKSPEFLNNFEEQRKVIFAENNRVSNNETKDDQNLVRKSTESPPSKIAKKKSRTSRASTKTVIESSDGSVKPGKKSGKEFWQHTKKWSRGFVESYNAETDPDVKATMRDIGKGLDRWITEEEIQEAAELMDKLPERNNEFVQKKLDKLKREMELYGPQAVVSKYREYADNGQEEDYLWWLDLPHILCIELYTVEGEEQRIGFYSLEMATDLELDPKPHHVIAFEDANDCKNLCYIIQAQLEMHGNGNAFVVAQLPKDAFRDAKENGFNVTVIRKGELKFDIDQPLEEAEEQICAIGSKMYHEMIMRDRSLDISTLTKGVFGFKGRPAKAKRKPSKKMLKKRGKK